MVQVGDGTLGAITEHTAEVQIVRNIPCQHWAKHVLFVHQQNAGVSSMQHRRRRLWVRSLVVGVVLCVVSLIPASLWHVPAARAAVAEFGAPASARHAGAIVASAREKEAATRAALLGQSGMIAQQQAPIQLVYFPQTGHHLGHGFLRFWRSHGGLLTFGYPISEEFAENGRTVQYFERVRFEYHPEEPNPKYQVQLALLGSELHGGRGFAPVPPGSGEQFFSETSHAMSGAFLDFWRKRGGAQVFGLPISEPFQETSATDGNVYTVQYFERARFELHPEDLDPYYRAYERDYGYRIRSLHEVQLSDLGRQVATKLGYAFAPATRQPTIPDWSPLLWSRRIDVNLSTQTLTAFEDDLAVFQAPIATGADGFNTPTGSSAIYDRYVRQDMVGAIGLESWYVPNIPWVQYFNGAVAFHGTYWHDVWGTGARMSHGCVNLNIDDAEWLFEWAGVGTQVNVFY
jgi:hypothetical protein